MIRLIICLVLTVMLSGCAGSMLQYCFDRDNCPNKGYYDAMYGVHTRVHNPQQPVAPVQQTSVVNTGMDKPSANNSGLVNWGPLGRNDEEALKSFSDMYPDN